MKKCPFIRVNDEVREEVRKFATSEELLRSGGISTDALDRLAFGFSNSDITELMPEALRIKWKDDLENVKWEIQKSGKTKKGWANKINLSEPIDVSFERGKFWIEDGHHRYMAAKILKKPLGVNLEIKSNPIIALAPELSYDDFHRCLFNQIKSENQMSENKKGILKEYLKQDEVFLKKYFSMTDQEKKESLPHDFPYFFEDFLEENDIEFEWPTHVIITADGEEPGDKMETYEVVEYIQRKNPELFNAYADYLFNRVENNTLPVGDEEYPAWYYFNGTPQVVKNQWLIHFTDDADSVAREGFKYGVEDVAKLGLTTQLSKIEKSSSGFNFAYLLSDFRRYGYKGSSLYKYGKEAVIFRASGIKMWHHGDQEPQVIFYGPSANNIIPLTPGEDGKWAIFSKSGRELFANDDLEKTVAWLTKNWDQYRKSLNESGMNELRKQIREILSEAYGEQERIFKSKRTAREIKVKVQGGRIIDVENESGIRFPFEIGSMWNRNTEVWACNNHFLLDGQDTCPEEKIFGVKVSDVPRGHEWRTLFPNKFRE